MCGIFGIWHIDGRPLDLSAVHCATHTLRHRGPDDEGFLLVDTRQGRVQLCGSEKTASELALPRIEQFQGEHFDLALGFRRLAILDLSPAGHQPMSSPDGQLWLIFNGEIYNYIELRRELISLGHSFKTGTDTEVILAAYRQWGPDCVRRFNGMWALALWDNEQRHLFVSRDRFGVKPFYMTTSPAGPFAFGSEIKALLAAGAVQFRPNPLAVARFVAQGGYLSHERGETFFEGVREMPAAHSAIVTRRGYSPTRYWQLPSREDIEEVPRHEVESNYRDLFTDAVRLRLRADVPVGTCLSGGVDSSSIVAVAGQLMRTEHAISLERLGDHQQTFSAVYNSTGPWNERKYIDKVVESTGAAGNQVVPTEGRLWSDLEQLVWHQDEPFQSTSIFAQWCVMSLAHEKGVTVLLDGQGADETLAGYRPFDVWVAEMMRGGNLPGVIKGLRDVHAIAGANPLRLITRALAWQTPRPALARLRKARVQQALSSSGLHADVQQLLSDELSSRGDSYSAQQNLHSHLASLVTEDSLPNLLRYEDRNSMAFSIESRVPFLDYRLVEYTFTKAAHWRIHDGWTKWVQRAAVQDILPPEITWRRDKVGFETPEKQWLREGSAHILDLLERDDAGNEYLDVEAIRRETPRLLEAGDVSKVWRWLNVVLWLRSFSGLQAKSERL